jgi:hypothetical protein
VTFIVRGIRSDDTTTAVRLRADTAVAKARDLIVAGWQVFIEGPDGIRNYPDEFDNLLSGSRDDSALPLRQTESGCFRYARSLNGASPRGVKTSKSSL